MTDEAPLESGYGPGTPPGDNLCNDFQQETARSFSDFAAALGGRVSHVEGVLTMTDLGSALPFHNRAVLEQPAADAAEVVARLHEFYGAGTGGPFLLESAWPTADLRPAGFTLMGHPPLMVRSPLHPLPDPAPGLRVVRATDATTAADLERTLIDGYPAPMLAPFREVRFFTPAALAAPGWNHFVGYEGGRPVAVGSSYVGSRLLRVENIATLPDARGRGFGRAITAAAIGADSARTATLIASDLGRPVYERLGFVAVSRSTYWLGAR